MRFDRWLADRMSETGETTVTLGRRMGYSDNAIRAWLDGKHIPTPFSIECIESVLGPVPQDVLDAEFKVAKPQVRAAMTRKRAIALMADGVTPRQVAERLPCTQRDAVKWWTAHCNTGVREPGAWTKNQERCLLQWRRDGRGWDFISQCLGRSMEKCQLRYEYLTNPPIPLKSHAANADGVGKEAV